MEHREIILYNIENAEKLKIKEIFMNLNIEVEITEVYELEDIIAYPALCVFIKKPEDKQKMYEIKEILSVTRGWQINFIVDEKFFENSEKIKEKIQNYYEENEKLKIRYDYSEVIKDGIIGMAIGDALRSTRQI